MNYSLSSSRKIGTYTQKIVTTMRDTTKAASVSFLDGLKAWHGRLDSLDPTGRETGSRSYKGFMESDSSDTSNTGGKCNATISILITEAWKPKITTFKVENVAYANFASIVDADIYGLTGAHANDSSVYIISAIIDIIS